MTDLTPGRPVKLATRLWGSLLLKPVERRVSSYSAGQSRAIRDLFSAASAQAEASFEMLDSDNVLASVELSRTAAVLYMRAVLAAQPSSENVEDIGTDEVWKKFLQLVEQKILPSAPSSFEKTRAILHDDSQAWRRLSVGEAIERADPLRSSLRWLHGLIEPRTVAEVVHQRWRRLIGLGLVASALLAWGAVVLFTPRNVALHQPTQASSKHLYSIGPEGGLVDGIIDQPYGAHTGVDVLPWVMVDLGRTRRLSRIKIYNRGDGWFDDSLPLVLEFSDNATDFVEVDRRTTTFSQSDPWVFAAAGKRTRYVRVTGKPNGFIALSEIEAYAR